MQRKFETKYGYFTEDGKEYVITDYRTPRPWVNVISNGDYGLVISQVNGGFSWKTHANLNRLTRWQQDLLQDNWGKFIYLRDEKNGTYWSPTVQPVLNELDEYACHHGIGYTIFHSKKNNIETEFKIFIPFDDNLEIWTLKLKNLGDTERIIGVYTYLEWALGVSPDNHREFHKTFLETEFDEENQVLLAKKRLWEIPSQHGHWNVNWKGVAYFASDRGVDGYEGDKEQFLGRFNTLQNPGALNTGKLSGTTGKWGDAIASLKRSVQLQAHEEKELHFFLGVQEEESSIFPIIDKYRDQSNVKKAFSKVQEKWNAILETTTVHTPDDALNIMTNTWLKYQAISGRLWARAAYYQQSGAYGYRDQLQDSQIFLYSNPQFTKTQISLHAKHQFKDGKVLHWWHPITEQGLDGKMSDDLLWLPFITIQYLKETADWDILKEKERYYDADMSDSILKHCLKAIEKTLSQFSKRGLPLILTGDWNDGLSAVGLEGQGESIWLAHFLYYILQEFQVILNKTENKETAAVYERKAGELRTAINEIGWDGKWFWRASKDNGQLIGSSENEHGKIYLNAQIWAAISGSTTHQRQEIALQSVEQHLEGENGPLLLYPAYQIPDPLIGYLSRYAPGLRENGGVYTHAATWSIWAACLLSQNDFAYRIYKKLSPIYNGMKPDKYFAEPYVTPGNIDGPDSPHYGRGGWTWYTGSAAWLFRVTMDYLIGIRADYEGLRIQPCFPLTWKSLQVKRYFRGINYKIDIINEATDRMENLKITVDGNPINGNLIPVAIGKDTVNVTVTIL